MISTIHLFPAINTKLIQVLRELTPADWERPTICPLWKVKDIAAHLLDGNLRKLSVSRDKYTGDNPGKIDTHEGLVDYLNELNEDWVYASKRMSPQVIIEMLEITNEKVFRFFQSLPPHGQSFYPVAWAGETVSENWFDIAREYTERWLHQQQIRLACKKQGLMDRELYHPFLQTFMMGLPHTYRNTNAETGDVVKISVIGEGGAVWFLKKTETNWKLYDTGNHKCKAEVSIPGGIAWRLFSKGLNPEEAKENVKVEGDLELGSVVLNMVSVMA